MIKRILLMGYYAETITNVVATILTIGATTLTGIIFSKSVKTIKKIEDCESKEKFYKEKYEEANKRVEELEMIINKKDARE